MKRFRTAISPIESDKQMGFAIEHFHLERRTDDELRRNFAGLLQAIAHFDANANDYENDSMLMNNLRRMALLAEAVLLEMKRRRLFDNPEPMLAAARELSTKCEQRCRELSARRS